MRLWKTSSLAVISFLLIFCASFSIAAYDGIVEVCEQSCPYRSIQRAIEDSPPGSTIDIDGGIYRETIVIDKTVTLRGEGWLKTEVRGVKEGYSVIEVVAPHVSVTVQGMTVSRGKNSGISIGVNSTIKLISVSVEDNSGHGLMVAGSARASVVGSRFIENSWSGIELYDSSHVEVSNSEISNNEWAGIELSSDSVVLLADSRVVNNVYGLKVWDDARISSIGSEFVDNHTAVAVNDGCWVDLEENLFAANYYSVDVPVVACSPIVEARGFEGVILGDSNIFRDNRKNLCPPAIKFLGTGKGGKHDW